MLWKLRERLAPSSAIRPTEIELKRRAFCRLSFAATEVCCHCSSSPIRPSALVRLDGDYVRGEALDIAALLTREDFTERVAAIAPTLAGDMATAHAVLLRRTPLPGPCNRMTRGRSAHCTTFAYTNPNVPAYSIHDIARIGSSRKTLEQLVDGGILSIVDVPLDFPLSDNQRNQVNAARSGRAAIDEVAISAFLATMHYPIAFLDYETYPCGVPRFAGYSPFDQIPFQFSLDVVAHPGGVGGTTPTVDPARARPRPCVHLLPDPRMARRRPKDSRP
jgi:hypothetical protein